MRRTEQEFKEEVLRRTKAYRQEQARKRKKLLGAGICAGLCCVALAVLASLGAASEAPDAVNDMKLESAVSMQTAGGTDSGIITDEAPAEFAAAPMAPPEPEEAKGENPAAEAEGNTSYSDKDGWVRYDEDAAGKLETALAQESDTPAVTIIYPDEEVTLDEADSVLIMDLLSSAQWIPTAANCLCDYTLEVGGEIYRYHSDCGTIQNESGASFTLCESDRITFNEIIGTPAE